MSELKPCPFCGGEASLGQGIMTSDNKHLWECECIECGIMTADGYDTKEEAIEAWNNRAEGK